MTTKKEFLQKQIEQQEQDEIQFDEAIQDSFSKVERGGSDNLPLQSQKDFQKENMQ